MKKRPLSQGRPIRSEHIYPWAPVLMKLFTISVALAFLALITNLLTFCAAIVYLISKARNVALLNLIRTSKPAQLDRLSDIRLVIASLTLSGVGLGSPFYLIVVGYTQQNTMGCFGLATILYFLFLAKCAHGKTPVSFSDIEINDIEGGLIQLNEFSSKPVLVANVASECGYTEMGYRDLNAVYNDLHDKIGLEVIAVPCNQFGQQEPGGAEAIETFIREEKDSRFIIAEKVDVNGPHTHPLYRFLKGEHIDDGGCRDDHTSCGQWATSGECQRNPRYMLKSCRLSCKTCERSYQFGGDVAWNFEYFLVDKGVVVNRWKTGTTLTSADILNSIRNDHKEL